MLIMAKSFLFSGLPGGLGESIDETVRWPQLALPAGNWTPYPQYFGKKSSYPPVGHRGAADHSCAVTASSRRAWQTRGIRSVRLQRRPGGRPATTGTRLSPRLALRDLGLARLGHLRLRHPPG